MSTYVLVPGACHGAWCFDDLVERLRAAGHDVHALTSGTATAACW
jgi:hypothetical protein